MLGRTLKVDFGLSLAISASCISFVFALIYPHFLNMFWQIPDGREVLTGHIPDRISYAIVAGPLFSQEWIFEAAFAWFVDHGAYGCFVLVCAGGAALTPLLTYFLARACRSSDLAAGVVSFLVIGSRFSGSAIRAETFAVDAFALEFLTLVAISYRWWSLPVVVFWANVHASAVLAPVIALVFVFGQWWANGKFDRQIGRLLTVMVAITLVTLVTPFGVRLWFYALSLAIGSNPVRLHLDTWRALAFDTPGALLAVLPGLVILLWLGVDRKRSNYGLLAVAIVIFGLTIGHARYATFLVVGWAPAIAQSLDHVGFLSRAMVRRRTTVFALLPLFVFAYVRAVPILTIPVEPLGPWQAAANLVKIYHLEGNAYVPYVWAAFLHWRGLPVRVLIDAHGDSYSESVWNDHLVLESGLGGWRDVLRRRHIAVVVIPGTWALAQELASDSDWELVGKQDGVLAFRRR